MRRQWIQAVWLVCLMAAPAIAQKTQTQRENGQRPAPTLVWKGNTAFKNKELAEALRFEIEAWSQGLPKSIVAADCAYQLEQTYHAVGYAEATSTVRVSEDPPGLIFEVNEGPKMRISTWLFPGSLPTPGLAPEDLKLLYTEGEEFPWVPRELKRMPERIERAYRSLGYLDVAARDPQSEMQEKPDRWQVTIAVEPGPLYTLESVTTDLPSDSPMQSELTEALTEALAAVTANASSDLPYQPSWRTQWVRAAQKSLADAGYLDATVTPTVTPTGEAQEGKVRVHLAIQTGDPIRLGQIHLPQEMLLRESFVRRRMGLQEGQTLSPDALDDALIALYRTGRLKNAQIEVEGTGPVRDVRVLLEERFEREAFIEPGYGSFEGARLRLGWRHHNVGGTARGLRAEAVLAERAERQLIGWTDPWTLGHGLVFDASADREVRRLPAYDRETVALGTFVTRTFGNFDRWTTHAGMRYASVKVDDVKVDLVTDPELAEDLESTTLEWGIGFDSRNHPLLPRSGQQAQLTLQQSIQTSGSATPYGKAQLSWSGFKKLSDKQTLAFGARATAIMPVDGDVLPLGLRLFSGGENTVRSFKEAELGPKDADGTPVGGEARSTFSVEYQHDLGESPWQAAFFVDMGNLVGDAADLLEFKDQEIGLGLGLRYILPIGPVRMDWGYNPDPGDDDPTSVLHLSVGMAF